MHVSVQKLTSTTFPRSSAASSGSEFSHPVAPANDGIRRRSNIRSLLSVVDGTRSSSRRAVAPVRGTGLDRTPGMADTRVFVITGASSGIGASTARHAAEAGYRVGLAARSQDKLDALVSELGEQALAVVTDVTRWEDNEALIAAATDAFGRVDVVYANAGFGAKRGWLEETPDFWHDMVVTNVLGAAYTVRAAIPALKATRGHVLLTGSVAGRRVLPGSLYSCTKWAITAMAEAVRADLNGTGVRT